MITAIDHLNIVVADLERSVLFYTELLGFRLMKEAQLEGEWIDRIVGLKGTAVNVQARIAPRTLFPLVSSCPLGGRFQGLIAKRRISTDDR